MFLKSLFSSGKDAIAKSILGKLLDEVGELTDFHLDTDKKSISMVVKLKGEPEKVELNVLKYYIESADGKNYLVVVDLYCSKEWVNLSYSKWKPELKIPLPSKLDILL